MRRRRLAVTAVGLILAGALGARWATLAPAPLWQTIAIGNPIALAVDSRLGRAFILDYGALSERVTLTGNGGWMWSSGGNATVRILDTHSGKLVAALDVPRTAQGLIADPTTGRVFVVDQAQVEVIDARRGKLLATQLDGGNVGLDAPTLSPAASAVDGRSGRVVVALERQDPTEPAVWHLLVLDGRSGQTLHVVTFPMGSGSALQQPNGASPYTSLSMALDQRDGRLYVFTSDRRMRVLDMASGRILAMRRLPLALTDAVMDARSGRIFALAWPPHMTASTTTRRLPTATVVLLDPHSGAIRRRRRVGAFWPYLSLNGPRTMGVDAATGRAFVLDALHNAVDVLDGASGRLVRAVTLSGTPYSVLMDSPHGRALVETSNQPLSGAQVAVLDARTGALRRTITFGQFAFMLAVDSRTGHVVATSGALSASVPDRWAWIPRPLRARLPGIPPPPPPLGPSERLLTHMALTLDPS